MILKIEQWNIEAKTGYKPITTFYQDFSIADLFGLDAIKDTYNRAFSGWKTNYKYITELVMVLNHKCWAWYRRDIQKSELYANLYEELNDWCFDNLKGQELEYFIQVTD